MTATAHALVGASIAKLIPNPYIALPAAFVSHFVFDKLPHWDVMTAKDKSKKQAVVEMVIDVLMSFALVALFFMVFTKSSDPILIFGCAFVAQLPDWLELPYLVLRTQIPFFYQNYKFQKWIHDIGFDSRMKAPLGVVTQVVVVVIFLAIVLFLR